MVKIYGLTDPLDARIRYVGRTTMRPLERLRSHVAEASGGDNSRKSRWIRRLTAAGVTPHLVVLDECEMDDAEAVERSWIANFRGDLLNVQSGSVVSRRTIRAIRAASEPADLDSFAGRLRWARARAGLSARALATNLGLSPDMVAQIERGRRDNVTARSLYALAGALSVSAEWLFLGIGDVAIVTSLRSSA